MLVFFGKEGITMAQTLRSHFTFEAQIERFGRVAGIAAAAVAIVGVLYFLGLYLLSN
jgi:hypothetical protein